MPRSLNRVGKVRRALNLVALLVMVGCGGTYALDVWINRQIVAEQVQEPMFQDTHFGSGFWSGMFGGAYCGEVSGINGFGMRSPYFRFVVLRGEVQIFPMTTDRIKINDFENLWVAQCND